MSLSIDTSKCTGCGLCSAICPHAFRMNTTNTQAEVIDPAATGAEVDDAIVSCPSQAISRE